MSKHINILHNSKSTGPSILRLMQIECDWALKFQQMKNLENYFRKLDALLACGLIVLSKNMEKFDTPLSDITNQFFSEIKLVAPKNFSWTISIDEIRPHLPGVFLVCHEEDWFIIQETNSDVIYILEGSEETLEDPLFTYENIFEYIYHMVKNENSLF